MSPKDRAAELRRLIDHHNRKYYIEAAPEISDREFDRMLEELQKIEKAHPELVTPDSPTQRVGGAPIDEFRSVKHRVPMLSIDNTYNPDEVREWDKSIRKLLGGESPCYVVELKIDGVAMSLRYEHGRLVPRGRFFQAPEIAAGAPPTQSSDFIGIIRMTRMLMPFVRIPEAIGRCLTGRADPTDAELQQTLLRFETVNPPGNESLVAGYLKEIAEKDGLSTTIVEKTAGRGNFMRLRGKS